MYIWQRPGWPDFRQDHARLAAPLGRARHAQGRLRGRMEALGPALRGAAMLGTLTEDVVTSGGIDGDSLDPGRVRAAIAHRLGRPRAGAPALDHRAGEPPAPDPGADGIVEMTLDATRNCAAPLTGERLCAWHAALYPGGCGRPIRAGRWRDDADGPMEIVSGPPGLQRVHYTAPPAGRVAGEMAGFLDWFEDARAGEPVLAAGLAYLRFLSIYPFEDGNERIARAITDMALARSDGERFYSLSAQISRDREDYYAILEAAQTGGLDVTRLAGMVPRMPRPRDRQRPPHRRPRQGPPGRDPCAQPTPDEDPRPAARRDGGQAHLVRMGGDEPLFPGHGEPGYPRSGRAGDSDAQRGWGAEHEVWVGGGVGVRTGTQNPMVSLRSDSPAPGP